MVSHMNADEISDRDGVRVLGEGEFWSWCETCYQEGSPPNGDGDVVLYRTDEASNAKMEARDHREWNPDHHPVARGPDGERIYG